MSVWQTCPHVICGGVEHSSLFICINFRKIETGVQQRSQSKIWGSKCLALGKQQYFRLAHRFSKYKITRYAKYFFGGHGPWVPLGYAYADVDNIDRLFFCRKIRELPTEPAVFGKYKYSGQIQKRKQI